MQITSKYVTVKLDTDEERINLLYIQTYSWKEKLAVLMLSRFQGSLQRTKTLIFNLTRLQINVDTILFSNRQFYSFFDTTHTVIGLTRAQA